MPNISVSIVPRGSGILDRGFTAFERAEILRQVYQMKILRMSIPDIAVHFGVGNQTVAGWLQEAIQEQLALDQLTIKELQRLEVDTLDMLQAKLIPSIDAGQISAIEMARKISESRRKLLGLDAPEQHDLRVAVRQYKGIDVDAV